MFSYIYVLNMIDIPTILKHGLTVLIPFSGLLF